MTSGATECTVLPEVELLLEEVKLAEFLRVLPGRAFCYLCLARMLEVSQDEIREAARALSAVPGFQIRARPCENCERDRMTLQWEPVTR